MKIPIKKWVDDETLSWAERFESLKSHHENETKFLLEQIEGRPEIGKPEPIALFDMDGTLCDFVAGMAAAMKPLEGPGESWDYESYDQDNEPPHMKARRRLVKSQPGFWRNLPRYEPGFMLLRAAIEAGFRIVIFTKAPRAQPNALSEKGEWCRDNLSSVYNYDLSMVTDKGLHYGKLLVDDWPPYIESWLKHRPRGHVIMPAHKYNATFEHPQVTRFVGWNEDIWALMNKIREECA